MPERFLIRLVGGPAPMNAGVSEGPWPLPDEIPSHGGKYVKRSESTMPPQEEGSRLMRGAEYFWEGEDGPVLCAAIDCSNIATHTWSGYPTCDDCAAPMRGSLLQ